MDENFTLLVNLKEVNLATTIKVRVTKKWDAINPHYDKVLHITCIILDEAISLLRHLYLSI